MFTFLGALIGVFILHPLTMVIYWYEANSTVAQHLPTLNGIFTNIAASFSWEMSLMAFVFTFIGAGVGFTFWFYHTKLDFKERIINILANELERDIHSLIERGESETLEFKSSARWDYQKKTINRALEMVIIKTLAGLMNNKGGNLLIGISDSGEALGLRHDYASLRKKNRDGYEQFIIGLISTHLGADLCVNASVFFQNFSSEEICRVVVAPSVYPVYSKNGEKTQFFLRTGSGTRELNVKEAFEYITHHWPKYES